MKKLFLLLLPFLFFCCTPKIVYVPSVEYTRVEVRDTVDSIKLVPVYEKIQTPDTLSALENAYAFSKASWSAGFLTHTLGVKPVNIPVKIQVKTIYKDKTTTVNILTDEQVAIIKENPELKKQITKLQKDSAALKAATKKKNALLWKLYGLIAVLGLWIFRKPLLKLIKL